MQFEDDIRDLIDNENDTSGKKRLIFMAIFVLADIFFSIFILATNRIFSSRNNQFNKEGLSIGIGTISVDKNEKMSSLEIAWNYQKLFLLLFLFFFFVSKSIAGFVPLIIFIQSTLKYKHGMDILGLKMLEKKKISDFCDKFSEYFDTIYNYRRTNTYRICEKKLVYGYIELISFKEQLIILKNRQFLKSQILEILKVASLAGIIIAHYGYLYPLT